jgi:hypothetical protein
LTKAAIEKPTLVGTAANFRFEPNLPIFCVAANVRFRSRRSKPGQDQTEFCQGIVSNDFLTISNESSQKPPFVVATYACIGALGLKMAHVSCRGCFHRGRHLPGTPAHSQQQPFQLDIV